MLITAALPASLGIRVLTIGGGADGGVEVSLASIRAAAPCPTCGTLATRLHSRYVRTIADLPWQGVPVCLRLTARRFVCEQAGCSRRIFAERFPGLAVPHGRRSDRLAALLTAIALAAGGEGGSRLVSELGLTTSPDTLLRLLRAAPLPPTETPRVLGIDDWAWRRGRRYGTVLVDLEQHHIVDLLPDRTAETLAAWLATHPGVEIIARDRSPTYADGTRQGAPGAIQVADRWHLLANVGDALERFLLGHKAALRAAATAPTGDAAAADRTAAARSEPPLPPGEPDERTEHHRLKPGTARLRARYAEVQALRAAGHSVKAIRRETGLARPTIRKYLRATSCPERSPRPGFFAPGSPWERRLRERWDADEHNAAALWRALRAEGFPGSAGSLRRHVGGWRAIPGRRGRPPIDEPGVARASPVPAPPPSPRQVRWWLLRPGAALTAKQVSYLERLGDICPGVHTAQQLARDFGRLIRERDGDGFDGWLTRAAASEVAELRAMATGMRRDYAAIVTALTLPWSNGQTEGQVTRLKLVKRQMYGRGGLDLLRCRLVRSA
jgi:transposase